MTDFFVASPSDRQRAHIAIDKHDLPFRIRLAKGGRRSTEQNAYLWGVCYEVILAHGLKDQGWRNEDLHQYLLGEHFGWETLEGFGHKRVRPIKRSSGLSKTEFADYIGFIQQFGSERGIYIPDPNEEYDGT